MRYEWLEQALQNPDSWEHSTTLGNRQVDSLKTWLRTCGIKDYSGFLTVLGQKFIKRGCNHLPLWELLWINVVFNFPTACWYTTLEEYEWTTTSLRALLHTVVPRLGKWTISNAIMELAGLLERTPVGTELGQGQVFKERPRRIVRTGHKPSDTAIRYSLCRLFHKEKQQRLEWNSVLTWPWVVFGCRRSFIWNRLTTTNHEYFSIDENGIVSNMEPKEGWQCGDMMTTLP
jgi:hypothetical protein